MWCNDVWCRCVMVWGVCEMVCGVELVGVMLMVCDVR